MTPVTITVAGQTAQARFQENATTAWLLEHFPLALPMLNLYGREMSYRFPDPLPAEAGEPEERPYTLGEIAYWPPRHSFVIFYKQDGALIKNLHPLGQVESGLDVFAALTGDAEVVFARS